jgi:hypothetical protein
VPEVELCNIKRSSINGFGNLQVVENGKRRRRRKRIRDQPGG